MYIFTPCQSIESAAGTQIMWRWVSSMRFSILCSGVGFGFQMEFHYHWHRLPNVFVTSLLWPGCFFLSVKSRGKNARMLVVMAVFCWRCIRHLSAPNSNHFSVNHCVCCKTECEYQMRSNCNTAQTFLGTWRDRDYLHSEKVSNYWAVFFQRILNRKQSVYSYPTQKEHFIPPSHPCFIKQFCTEERIQKEARHEILIHIAR